MFRLVYGWLCRRIAITHILEKRGVDLSPLFFVTELAFGDPHAFLPNAQDDKIPSCHTEEALSRREHLGTLVPFLLVLTEPAFGDPHAFLQNAQDDRKSKVKASPFDDTEYFAF